jgi:hypothetical protein
VEQQATDFQAAHDDYGASLRKSPEAKYFAVGKIQRD